MEDSKKIFGTIISCKEKLIGAIYQEKDQWILWYVVFFIFGIATYFKFLDHSYFLYSTICFVTLCAIFLITKRLYYLLPIFFLLGVNIASIREASVDTKLIPHPIKNVWVKGYVGSISYKPDGKSIIITEKNRIYKNKIKIDKLRILSRSANKAIEVGDYINFKATIVPPRKVKKGEYNFARHDFYKKISGTGFANGRIKLLRKDSEKNFQNSLNKFRRFISDRINRQIGERYGALSSALIVGDKSSITKEDFNSIRIAGLSHMFAVSGLHLSLIAIICFYALRYSLSFSVNITQKHNTKKIAAVITSAVALFYLFSTGLQISAIRSYIMILLVMIAVIFDLFSDMKRAIAFAAFSMLIFRPELVLQPGFQLSFIATLALIAAYEIYKEEKSEHRFLHGKKILIYFIGILFSTIIASIATSMFVIYHFHFISNYSIIANLLVNPVMGFIIMPFVVLFFFLLPVGLDWVALYPIKYGLYLLIKITQLVGQLKHSVISDLYYSDLALFIFTSGIFWLCLLNTRVRYFGLLVISLSFII